MLLYCLIDFTSAFLVHIFPISVLLLLHESYLIPLARDHGLPVLGHLLLQAGILELGPSSDARVLGFDEERSLGVLGCHAGLCGARARHLDRVRKLEREGKRFAADAATGMNPHVS